MKRIDDTHLKKFTSYHGGKGVDMGHLSPIDLHGHFRIRERYKLDQIGPTALNTGVILIRIYFTLL